MFANLLSFSTQALLTASLLLPLAAAAGSHSNPLLNRHHELARRAEGDVELHRRVSNARWSFYNVETGNAGSCGKFHVNSDFTVAMNAGQMNSGMCFKTITMTYNGKTTTATVSDTCPGCPYGGLDLTEGLFSFFAPQSVGIIYGTWEFTDAAPPAQAAPPKPTTTKKPDPVWVPPTTTWTPVWVAPITTSKKPVEPTTTKIPTTSVKPVPSTTSTPPSSSSVRPSSSSSSSRASSTSSSVASGSSINYQSGVASGLAVPTGVVDRPTGSTQNLVDLFNVFIQVGGVAAVANSL